MSTTDTQIANMALSAAGARSTIADITVNDGSVEWYQTNLHYATTRDAVLRMANWNFATKFINATLLKALPGTPENQTIPTTSGWLPSYPAPPWLYSYAWPSDCVRVRKIMPQFYTGMAGTPIFSTSNNVAPSWGGPPVRFLVSSDLDMASGQQITIILTNQPSPVLCYTVQTTNPALFDNGFQDAFLDALTAKLAFALSGNVALANQRIKEANDSLRQAQAMDGNEGLTINDVTPDWIAARGSNGVNYAGGPGYLAQPYAPFFGGW